MTMIMIIIKGAIFHHQQPIAKKNSALINNKSSYFVKFLKCNYLMFSLPPQIICLN